MVQWGFPILDISVIWQKKGVSFITFQHDIIFLCLTLLKWQDLPEILYARMTTGNTAATDLPGSTERLRNKDGSS